MTQTVYCPRCGTLMERRQVDDREREVCPACGFVFYRNPVPAVGVVVAVFSDLFGLLGALLAVPLAAVFQVLLDHVMLAPAAPEQLEIGGRDKLALLRYQTQDLANDLRQQVRSKTEEIDAGVDATEEELEALLVDLDGLLAVAQEQRA